MLAGLHYGAFAIGPLRFCLHEILKESDGTFMCMFVYTFAIGIPATIDAVDVVICCIIRAITVVLCPAFSWSIHDSSNHNLIWITGTVDHCVELIHSYFSNIM